MSFLITLVALLSGLWSFSYVVLFLHRQSPRWSLTPVVLWIGALTTLLEFRLLGFFTISLPTNTVQLAIGSFVLLPTILLGLLLIYVIDGSTQARMVILGMVIISSAIFLTQFLLRISAAFDSALSLSEQVRQVSPRIPIASIVTLSIDMLVLVIVYQALSNWRKRFPSRLASGIALLSALLCDAFLFPLIGLSGTPGWANTLVPNILGKSLAGLAIWPMASSYLARIQAMFPGNAATTSRPALDIFTTQLELEKRERYRFGLLRTISQIDQLIVRTTSIKELFQKTCQLLTEGRDYSLVWIGTFDSDGQTLLPVASAGPDTLLRAALQMLHKENAQDASFYFQALRPAKTDSRPILYPNLLKKSDIRWQSAILASGIRAFAAFPLRQGNDVVGVLNVYANKANTFENPEEIELLQELADDLAYAMEGLEARQQQILLNTAAETMRDGLIITDFQGRIQYANPAVAQIFESSVAELEQSSIFSLMQAEQQAFIRAELLPVLRRKGQFTTEAEINTRSGRKLTISVMAALVRNHWGRSVNVVINARNVTKRKLYERHLITLNQMAAQFLQIHRLPDLTSIFLEASMELLKPDAIGIFLIDENSNKITDIYTRGLPASLEKRLIEEFSFRPRQDLITKGEILEISESNHQADDITIPVLLVEQGIRSILVAPVLFQSHPLGLLGLCYREPRQFQDTEKQICLALSNTLALGLQNTLLYQAENEQRTFAEAMGRAAAILNSSLDLDEVLERILEQAMSVIPCQSANLMLVEGDMTVIARQVFRSGQGEISSPSPNTRIPLQMPNLQQMLQSGEPILINNSMRTPLWTELDVDSSVRAYAAAPLMVLQKVIGFLSVTSNQADDFSRATTRHLSAFASYAAAALHNAQLYRDLSNYSSELEKRVQERTAELQLSEERTQAILASVPDAIIVLDPQDRWLEANHAGKWLQMQAKLEGKPLFTQEFLQQLRQGSLPTEKALIEIQGRSYQALASRFTQSDKPDGMIVVCRDVTRFRELDQMKSQFVSDVSHELRTPLTNLSLYTDLLANETNEAKRTRYLDTLRREISRLTQLIEDLLTISRLEAGRLNVAIQSVDLIQLVNNLVNDRESLAKQRLIALDFSAEEAIPLVQGDEHLVAQVLSNLLTNAMNYTLPGGEIHIVVAQKANENHTWVTVSISDTGVGIDPDDLPHIFDRFYRGKSSQRTSAPGTGLGLAISRELIEHQEGKITVSSTPNFGSTFTVWLKAVL